MKKYLVVPIPFVLTALVAGFIWNTKSAPDADSTQRDMWDLAAEQAKSPGQDVKPSEGVKNELIFKWLLVGSVVSGMFLIILLFYDAWEGVRKWRLRRTHRRLERER